MREELSTQEAARFALVRWSVDDDEELSRAFRNALKLSAKILDVDRVGVWVYEEGGASILCGMLFDRRTGQAHSGEVIQLATCSDYAKALESRRVVTAGDARNDPRTRELLPYLETHGIYAMLDCPIFQKGDVVGVVCHEHSGAARAWTASDEHFAATVADMLGLYLEQRAARVFYEQLLEARQELERRRVMESLGRMAANVAHDFNNVLLALQLRTEFLRKDPEARACADAGADVLQIVGQGRRLVRNLLDLASLDHTPNETIDLGAVLREMEPALRALAGAAVSLSLSLSDVPVMVRIERSRAEQVLMNLVKNACDAALEGGRVSVSLTVEEGQTNAGAVQSVARLVVVDTGVGMDAATRERAFEPFFTTKPREHGDGLGLSTVYGIAMAASGNVDIESVVGEGTTITVTLPRDGPAEH